MKNPWNLWGAFLIFLENGMVNPRKDHHHHHHHHQRGGHITRHYSPGMSILLETCNPPAFHPTTATWIGSIGFTGLLMVWNLATCRTDLNGLCDEGRVHRISRTKIPNTKMSCEDIGYISGEFRSRKIMAKRDSENLRTTVLSQVLYPTSYKVFVMLSLHPKWFASAHAVPVLQPSWLPPRNILCSGSTQGVNVVGKTSRNLAMKMLNQQLYMDLSKSIWSYLCKRNRVVNAAKFQFNDMYSSYCFALWASGLQKWHVTCVRIHDWNREAIRVDPKTHSLS